MYYVLIRSARVDILVKNQIKLQLIFTLLLVIFSSALVMASLQMESSWVREQPTGAVELLLNTRNNTGYENHTNYGNATINMTLVFPQNNSIIYNYSSNFKANMSYAIEIRVNSTFHECIAQINHQDSSGTTGGGNTSTIKLAGVDIQNRTWVSGDSTDSPVFQYGPQMLDGNWWYLNVSCYNYTHTTKLRDNITNTSMFVWRFKFYNEDHTFNIISGPTNGTLYSRATLPEINFTTNTYVRSCYLQLNGTDIVLTNSTANGDIQLYKNYDTVNDTVYWTNKSTLTAIWDGTAAMSDGQAARNITGYYNYTYYCPRTGGNASWSNTSALGTQSDLELSGVFFVDSTAPVNSTPYAFSDPTVNHTSGGHVLKIAVNITDHTNITCWARAWHETELSSQANATIINSDKVISYQNISQDENQWRCLINVTADDLDKTGVWTIQVMTQDDVGNNLTSTENKTIWVNKLYEGWSMNTFPNNYTMKQITSLTDSLSYVSYFKGDSSNKSFVTYTTGSALPEGSQNMLNYNVTWIYATSERTVMFNWTRSWENTTSGSPNYAYENITLFSNATGYNGWNVFSPLIHNTSLHNYDGISLYSIIHSDNCNNTDDDGGVNVAGAHCNNATIVSFYVQGYGYCSVSRFSNHTGACHPYYDANNLTINRGQGVWVYAYNENITYNRTGLN